MLKLRHLSHDLDHDMLAEDSRPPGFALTRNDDTDDHVLVSLMAEQNIERSQFII